MEIDLFTTIAQVVNFLILLFLLKYLLYGRITKAMDERKERIASELNDAAMKKKEAEEEAALYRKKTEELEEEAEERLRQAERDAELHKKELMKDVRQEVDQRKAKWLESVERQKQSFLRQLRIRSGEQVFAAARQVLKDLAGVELEQQIVKTFADRIDHLSEKEKGAIADFARMSQKGIAVLSSFDMPRKTQQIITKAVQNQIGKKTEMTFQTSPDLVCGIELRVGDRRISWNLDSYLNLLEDEIVRTLEEGPSTKYKV